MSFRERFEQLKALEEKTKQERLEAKQLEEERFLLVSESSLNEALKILEIEKRLTEIRDDIWQLGEIITGGSPKLSSYDSSTKPQQVYTLRAEWPEFIPAGVSTNDWGDEIFRWDDHVGLKTVELSVWVSSHWNMINVWVPGAGDEVWNPRGYTDIVGNSFEFDWSKINPQKAGALLDEILLKDSLKRQEWLPYTKTRKDDERIIVEHGFKPTLLSEE